MTVAPRRCAILIAVVLLTSLGFTPIDAAAASISPDEPATTGWATATGGTTGGAGAASDSTFVVTDRAELLAALNNNGAPDEPKIIYISGTVNGNEAADGRLLGAQDYAPGYDIDLYLGCFGADGWSDALHPYCGEQRRLRQTGSNNLKRQIEVTVPSNTTILGIGDDAGLTAATVVFHVAHNIIIRNLTIEAPVDHFTSWDPNDGDEGSWNARFDAMNSVTADHIWVDHVTFTDGRYLDSAAAPGPNGKPINFHDGLFDMKDGTDFVTVTNSRFRQHDKTMLLGSGDDNADTDAGRLRITLAGNYFEATSQRSPRVRFGRVHVVNNYYEGRVHDPVAPLVSSGLGGHSYFLGLGYQSEIRSERNVFSYTGRGADPGIIITEWNATRFSDVGSWFQERPVDVNQLAAAAFEESKAAAITQAEEAGTPIPDWALEEFSTELTWDPSQEYTYSVLDSAAEVRWHGKHATGAGIIDVHHP